MERLLKAQTHNAVQPLQDTLDGLRTSDVHPLRSDVYKADLNEQVERRDLVNAEFEQLYWETIPEDSQVSLDQPFSFPCSRVDFVLSQEPILPISLQEAQKTAIFKKKRREEKANAKFMHRIPDTEFIKTPTYKVLTLTRQSRPTTRFVNVGSAFMNARELAKRQVVSLRKESQRKSKELKSPLEREWKERKLKRFELRLLSPRQRRLKLRELREQNKEKDGELSLRRKLKLERRLRYVLVK